MFDNAQTMTVLKCPHCDHELDVTLSIDTRSALKRDEQLLGRYSAANEAAYRRLIAAGDPIDEFWPPPTDFGLGTGNYIRREAEAKAAGLDFKSESFLRVCERFRVRGRVRILEKNS